MKAIAALLLMSSFSAFATVPQTNEMLFESLKGQFEYSASAIVSGLRIDTVLRHNEGLSCERETVTYGNGASEVTYSCSEI